MTRSLLLLFALLLPGLLAAAEKPNIILVMTDDQGYGPVGRHGHPWIKTPNLDKLYDQRVPASLAFSSAPPAHPTRSALMTGRHPLKNGITHTILERERMALDCHNTSPSSENGRLYLRNFWQVAPRR